LLDALLGKLEQYDPGLHGRLADPAAAKAHQNAVAAASTGD